MSKEMIPRKAWQRATNALLWYPDNLKEYADLLEEATSKDPEQKGNTSKPIHSDPTASAAVRLAANPRVATLRQEIEAVESAIAELRPEQKEIIRRRFWDNKKYVGGRRKPRQYDYLLDSGYSKRAMIRISKRIIVSIARYLGEI